MVYYQPELARIHHEAFGDYADLVSPGVISRLEGFEDIVELGCGSGALTRHLLRAGHKVLATDASPAMLDLAKQEVPEATPRLLVLPDDPIPEADAIVALGHVFNYLASKEEIDRGLTATTKSAGYFLTDMLDLSYGNTRQEPLDFFHEGDGWKLWTTNRFEAPNRVVRAMSIETADGVSEEVHVNVLVDVAEIANNLRARGMTVRTSSAFGGETLPPGFAVLEAKPSV